MGRWIAVLTLVGGILLGAGAAADAATASTFVGRVQGSDAYIAVVKEGRKISGYACNNGTFSRWLDEARLRGGRAPLRAGTTGQLLGAVRIAGRAATGTIEVGGSKRTFRARQVRGSNVGLHFGVAKQQNRLLVPGWILLPNGTQRGAVAGVNMETLSPLAPSRAPKLDPSAQTVQIGGDPSLPPTTTEPTHLVVIAIIAILIGLLLPAV
jgi:hypothetical protein